MKEWRQKPYVTIKKSDKNGTTVVVRCQNLKAVRSFWEVKRWDYLPYAWETAKGGKVVLPEFKSGITAKTSGEIKG